MLQEESQENLRSDSSAGTEPLSYATHLWDRMTDITDRLTRSVETLSSLKSTLKNSAELYDKISKFFDMRTITTTPETGSMVYPTGQFFAMLRTIGAHNTHISEQHLLLYSQVKALKADLKKTISHSLLEERKIKKEYAAVVSLVHLCKKKDADEKKAYEALRIQYQSSQKDQKKLEVKLTNSEKGCIKAENEYRDACLRLNAAHAHYVDRLNSILDVLEELDRKRIRITKSVFTNFAKLHNDTGIAISTNCSEISAVFNAIDENKDVRSFIKKCHTGNRFPSPEPFQPYPVTFVNIDNKSTAASTSTPTKPPPTAITTSSMPTTPPSSTESIDGDCSASKVKQRITRRKSLLAQESSAQPDSGDVGHPASSHSNADTDNDANDDYLRVRALYDFAAEDSDELSLVEGDIIVVYDIEENGWWYGSIRDPFTDEERRGYFPGNYVEDIQ